MTSKALTKTQSPRKESPVTERYAQRGASLVEYALLIGLVATIGIIAMRSLGLSMSAQFSYTAGVLKGE